MKALNRGNSYLAGPVKDSSCVVGLDCHLHLWRGQLQRDPALIYHDLHDLEGCFC